MKDYTFKAVYLDKGQPTLLHVCAPTAVDAHSETWLKLPKNRHSMVDTFEIVSISACQHQKGVIA